MAGYRFPKIHEDVLANGLAVVCVPVHADQTFEIAVQMPVGKYSDPPSKEGLVELLIGTMQKGAAGISSEQFAEHLEYRGAGLFADVGDEHLVFGCRCLGRFAEEVFPLFWQTICEPALDKREFGRLKKELLTSLRAETADPGSVADRHFFSSLYGKDHAAGRIHSLQSVSRLGVGDIRDFYQTSLGAGGSTVLIAGGFEMDQYRHVWKPLLEKWKGRISPTATPDFQLLPQKTTVRVIDKPSLSQVSFVMGHTVPGELSDARDQLALANYILGGGNFSSRLVSRVRTSVGHTYGIHSSISTDRNVGTFRIGTSTQNAQIGEVVETIYAVCEELIEEGVTSDELEKAKKFAMGNLAFQLEGLGNVVEKLLWLRQYERPQSHIENFEERIASVSLDSVNNSIREHFSTLNFTIVAVGNASVIDPVLRKRGPVKVYDIRARA